MINLLPPSEKYYLVAKRNKSLASVLGIMAVVCLVCFSLILVALKFYILMEVQSQKHLLEAVEARYQNPNSASTLEEIKKYNTILRKADVFYKKQTHVSSALGTILGINLQDGISFNTIAIESPKEATVFSVTLSGISSTRNTLLAFKETLESNPNMSDVHFTPESWIRPTAATFYVKFKITHDKTQ